MRKGGFFSEAVHRAWVDRHVMCVGVGVQKPHDYVTKESNLV